MGCEIVLPPSLPNVEVRIAWVDLNPQKDFAAFRESLSVDELERAGRFVSDVHRRRFIVRRAALRKMLGEMTLVPACELVFAYSKHGKPRLIYPNCPRLHFSVSHSGDIAVLAMTEDFDLGVDLENCLQFPEMDSIASRLFSSDEMALIAQLDEQHRYPAFYRCWTRKEAILKACGAGLTMPLNSFSVSVLAADLPAVLRCGGELGSPKEWIIRDLVCSTESLGTIAVRCGACEKNLEIREVMVGLGCEKC